MTIAVLTSGGDAPGMNAAIRAVVRTAINLGHEVLGIKDGYKGIIDEEFIKLSHDYVSGMLIRGGTFLGTARLPEFKEKEIQEKAYKILKKHKIDALVAIGGDGTYRGALALSKLGLKVVAVPGTIDNDLGGTDFTIGFHTALQTIVDSIDKLRDTSSSHQRCSIIETMGRSCGDLALYSGICGGAEFIITQQNNVPKQVLYDTLRLYKQQGRRHAIVVVTEQIYDVYKLAEEIEQNSGFSTRATILGHVQRGGSPAPHDRILATRLGSYAARLIDEGKTGLSVGVVNGEVFNQSIEKSINDRNLDTSFYRLSDLVS